MEQNSAVTKLDWYRTPIDKKTMADLMKMSDRKGFVFAGGHLGLLILTGALTVYVWSHFSFWYALPLIILHNNILSMLVAGIHELTHERVFKTTYWNRVFISIFSFIHWWNHPLSFHSHKDHHRYTCNNPLDKELLLPQSFSVFHNIIKPFFFNYEGFFIALKAQWGLARGKYPAIFGGGEEWTEHLISRLDDKEKKKISNFAYVILIGHFAIITVSLATGYWIIPLITSLAPFTLVVSQTLISYTQHIGLMSGVQDFRLNCRTYYTNPFFQFLYWNMNFHIEHHMYASVPCYNLPKLHNTIKHDLPHIPRSLWEVWIEICYIVNRQKKDPSYEYHQPFPSENGDSSRAPRQASTHKSSTQDSHVKYTEAELAQYKVWECTICAFIYDEAYGLPEEGIAPGTRWDDIPDDWNCPDCGVSKADFAMVERARFATLKSKQSGSQEILRPSTAQDSGVEYTEKELAQYKVWECTVCAFIYDEAYGLPEEGIAPGTRWEDIPDDWSCPDCGVSKSDFEMVERARFATLESKQPAGSAQNHGDPVVIVGSGLAGYRWTAEFRKLNKGQKVEIITRDGGESYPKPMLSNALLKSMSPEDLIAKPANMMSEELNATIRSRTTVSAIHPDKKTIELRSEDGNTEEIRYSKLILALGADQIEIPINGSGAEDILRVNDLDDYRTFREKLQPNSKVIILGGGLIGCEFANDLTLSDHKVHVIDLAVSPLSTLIPAEAGAYLQSELEKKNIQWHLETSITSVEKQGAQYLCTLSNGETLTGDIVLSAIGLKPRTDLAKAAGLNINQGIVVNEKLQTSNESIYALGDCAEIEGKVRPFIQPITTAAPVLARNVQGEDHAVEFPTMPVKVKTTSCEVVCVTPEQNDDGTWAFDTIEGGFRGLYKDSDGTLLGYALLGQAAKEKPPVAKPVRTLEKV